MNIQRNTTRRGFSRIGLFVTIGILALFFGVLFAYNSGKNTKMISNIPRDQAVNDVVEVPQISLDKSAQVASSVPQNRAENAIANTLRSPLDDARQKAADSRIMSDLAQLWALVEVNYSPATHQYPDTLSMRGASTLIDDFKKLGSSVVYSLNSDHTEFAISGALISSTSFYCMDSTETKTTLTSAPAGPTCK